jgi:hypothetical protein
MSNLIPSLSGTHAPSPLTAEAAGNATPRDGTLATVILGSIAGSQPSSLLARDIEQILSTAIMSIVLSHFKPKKIHQIVSCLAQPNQQDKVIHDACVEQMQSHNPPNTPMKTWDMDELAKLVEGPIPHILQLDFSYGGADLAIVGRCPNLQALNLDSTRLLNNESLLNLGTPLLQSLDITNCPLVSIEGLQNLQNLRCLKLEDCNVDDLNKLPPLLEHLTLRLQLGTKGELKHLTKLKSLNLLGYPGIYPNTILNTLIQIPSLQYIHLSIPHSYCPGLSSDSLHSLANEFSTPRFIYSNDNLYSNRPTPNIDPSKVTEEDCIAIYPSLANPHAMPTLEELDAVYSASG